MKICNVAYSIFSCSSFNTILVISVINEIDVLVNELTFYNLIYGVYEISNSALFGPFNGPEYGTSIYNNGVRSWMTSTRDFNF